LRIRILGCYGGSAPGMYTTSFLINERIALDAGALTLTLSLEEQRRITHVLVSHSHVDHLVTLPFLLDNILPDLTAPVLLYGPEDTVRCLRQHLFNGALWPDFTQISNGTTPVLRMDPLALGQTVSVHGVEVTPFRMEHEVTCYGYLLQEPRASVFVCGDTSSLACLDEVFRRAKGLRAVFVEASFPMDNEGVAEQSTHLSTASFVREVTRHIPREMRVLVSHIKPGYAERIQKEIEALALPNVSLLEQGREYRF